MASVATTRPGDVIRQLAGELPGELRVSPERLAAAYRERACKVAAVRPAAPKEPAISREPCPFCHIPGYRGCAHFLPYVPPTLPEFDARVSPPDGERMSILRGGGTKEKRHPIYDEIVEFCERAEITIFAFGRFVTGDPDLVRRLRLGSQPKPETLVRIQHYIERHG